MTPALPLPLHWTRRDRRAYAASCKHALALRPHTKRVPVMSMLSGQSANREPPIGVRRIHAPPPGAWARATLVGLRHDLSLDVVPAFCCCGTFCERSFSGIIACGTAITVVLSSVVDITPLARANSLFVSPELNLRVLVGAQTKLTGKQGRYQFV